MLGQGWKVKWTLYQAKLKMALVYFNLLCLAQYFNVVIGFNVCLKNKIKVTRKYKNELAKNISKIN